jgi:hypothetical protein
MLIDPFYSSAGSPARANMFSILPVQCHVVFTVNFIYGWQKQIVETIFFWNLHIYVIHLMNLTVVILGSMQGVILLAWVHIVFNPVLFISGLSCPHSVQTSLTQNCLKIKY